MEKLPHWRFKVLLCFFSNFTDLRDWRLSERRQTRSPEIASQPKVISSLYSVVLYSWPCVAVNFPLSFSFISLSVLDFLYSLMKWIFVTSWTLASFGSSWRLRSPPLSTRHCPGTLTAPKRRNNASSLTLAQEDCCRLTLHLLSVGRAPPWATDRQCSWTSNLEVTICQQTSEIRICHTDISDIRSRHFDLVSGSVDAHCSVNSPLNCTIGILLQTDWLTLIASLNYNNIVVV